MSTSLNKREFSGLNITSNRTNHGDIQAFILELNKPQFNKETLGFPAVISLRIHSNSNACSFMATYLRERLE